MRWFKGVQGSLAYIVNLDRVVRLVDGATQHLQIIHIERVMRSRDEDAWFWAIEAHEGPMCKAARTSPGCSGARLGVLSVAVHAVATCFQTSRHSEYSITNN